MSKKWEVDAEGRQLNERFVLNENKLGCLLCDEAEAAPEEYSLQQHFDTKHRVKFVNLSHQEKQLRVQELKSSLHSQQNMFANVAAKKKYAADHKMFSPRDLPNYVIW